MTDTCYHCPACGRDMDCGEPHTAECPRALAQDAGFDPDGADSAPSLHDVETEPTSLEQCAYEDGMVTYTRCVRQVAREGAQYCTEHAQYEPRECERCDGETSDFQEREGTHVHTCAHCASELVTTPLGDLGCANATCFLYDPSTREHGAVKLPDGQILCPTYVPQGSAGDLCPVCGLMPPETF